jgi:hypothetical protein
MKWRNFMKKQIGLTLMELVIAILVAIALGAGGIIMFKDATGSAEKAAKNDLGAKTASAITIYMAKTQLAVPPTGTQLIGVDTMGGVACDTTSGIYDKTAPKVNVILVDSAGNDISGCGTSAYSVRIPE